VGPPALILRPLEQIPFIKDLVKRLRRNPYLRKVCGYRDRPPCEAHFSQMKRRIGAYDFRIIEAWLRRDALRLRRNQPLSTAHAEELLLRVRGECLEVEFLAADSQFESQSIFELLESLKIGHI